MTTTTHRNHNGRTVTRMPCPGVVPMARKASDTGIGGRDASWPRRRPDGEDDREPTIVRGRD